MQRGTIKKILLFVILTIGILIAQVNSTPKLYVSMQYDGNKDRVYFVQDLETGTRCYALTGGSGSYSVGAAISCVKK